MRRRTGAPRSVYAQYANERLGRRGVRRYDLFHARNIRSRLAPRRDRDRFVHADGQHAADPASRIEQRGTRIRVHWPERQRHRRSKHRRSHIRFVWPQSAVRRARRIEVSRRLDVRRRSGRRLRSEDGCRGMRRSLRVAQVRRRRFMPSGLQVQRAVDLHRSEARHLRGARSQAVPGWHALHRRRDRWMRSENGRRLVSRLLHARVTAVAAPQAKVATLKGRRRFSSKAPALHEGSWLARHVKTE